MGNTAVSFVISQPLGAKNPKYTIPPTKINMKMYMNMKRLKIFGISLKKFEFSFSLAVAPH